MFRRGHVWVIVRMPRYRWRDVGVARGIRRENRHASLDDARAARRMKAGFATPGGGVTRALTRRGNPRRRSSRR